MASSEKNRRRFLKTYFKEKKQVGAVAPSSRFLVKKMCDKIDFESAKVILELGPGTGVFTKELLKRAGNDTKIFAFELNETFYQMLVDKFDDPRLEVLHRSADEIQDVLNENGIESVDAVLSSLPLAVIPKEIGNKIVSSSKAALKDGGKYIQYQYSLTSKKMIEQYFKPLGLNFVTINVPPAFIYTGTKTKED